MSVRRFRTPGCAIACMSLVLLFSTARALAAEDASFELEAIWPAYEDLAQLQKVDPSLLRLLHLAQAGVGDTAQFDALRASIALPDDASLQDGFFLDVLVGVREYVQAADLEAELGWALDIETLPELSARTLETTSAVPGGLAGELDAPARDGMRVLVGHVWIEPRTEPYAQPLCALAADDRVLAIEPSFIEAERTPTSVPDTGVNANAGWTWTGIGAPACWGSGITGAGTLIGIIDSGVDWDESWFLWPGGGTRVLFQWDQATGALITPGFGPICAACGSHGTHVGGIAATVAPEALLFDVVRKSGTANTLQAVSLVFFAGRAHNMPAVANLSFGHHFGPHDGTDLLSRGLAARSGPGQIIVAAAGNEGDDNIHTDSLAAPMVAGGAQVIGARVPGGSVTEFTFRLWGDLANQFSVLGVPPGWVGRGVLRSGGANVATVWIHNNPAGGVPGRQLVDVSVVAINNVPLPRNLLWGIDVQMPAGAIGNGVYDAWIAEPDSGTVAFAQPTQRALVCEPGNCAEVITVGSFNSRDPCLPIGVVTAFSSPGPTLDGRMKPDLVAPGCPIESACCTPFVAGAGVCQKSGTSMSTPHMAGAVALMLQVNPRLTPVDVLRAVWSGWFVRPADAMYAVPRPDFRWGWGKLCLSCDVNRDRFPDVWALLDGDSDGVPDLFESWISELAPPLVVVAGSDASIVVKVGEYNHQDGRGTPATQADVVVELTTPFGTFGYVAQQVAPGEYVAVIRGSDTTGLSGACEITAFADVPGLPRTLMSGTLLVQP